jgi:hypothetical protein
MRLVREFAFLLAILSLAAAPVIGVGCSDQSASKPTTPSEPKIDLGKKGDAKGPKSPAKKGRSDESGSTTGNLGVKPPKAPATDSKK